MEQEMSYKGEEIACPIAYSEVPWKVKVSLPMRVVIVDINGDDFECYAIYAVAYSEFNTNNGTTLHREGFFKTDRNGAIYGLGNEDPLIKAIENNKFLNVKKILQ